MYLYFVLLFLNHFFLLLFLYFSRMLTLSAKNSSECWAWSRRSADKFSLLSINWGDSCNLGNGIVVEGLLPVKPHFGLDPLLYANSLLKHERKFALQRLPNLEWFALQGVVPLLDTLFESAGGGQKQYTVSGAVNAPYVVDAPDPCGHVLLPGIRELRDLSGQTLNNVSFWQAI